ncbi:MAG: hypothetical protein ACKVP0_22640 [Pirellulaceae bacterium]
MSERFRQDLIRWLTQMDGNGVWSDEDTAREGLSKTTTENVVPIVVRWACDEVSGDTNTGLVPETVRNFSELHDYVDANKYGGAFSWPEMTGDMDDRRYVAAHCDFWNQVQDRVDVWLRAGRPN